MNKGQVTLPLLLFVITLSALLFWRANQFTQWWAQLKQQQRMYLCAKSTLAQRQEHAKDVTILNKVIVGTDVGVLIPPLSASAANVKKVAQALQQISGVQNFLKIIKNPYCSKIEKSMVARPVFNFQARNPSGTLPYSKKHQTFSFYSSGHILWVKSEQSRGPFHLMSHSFKTISTDKHFLNSSSPLPLSTYLFSPQ